MWKRKQGPLEQAGFLRGCGKNVGDASLTHTDASLAFRRSCHRGQPPYCFITVAEMGGRLLCICSGLWHFNERCSASGMQLASTSRFGGQLSS